MQPVKCNLGSMARTVGKVPLLAYVVGQKVNLRRPGHQTTNAVG